MNQKLPSDAFSYYVSLGPVRSYDAVAARFGVSRRTVVRTAEREDWVARLAAIEKSAREKSDQAAVDALAEMQIRHQKMLRAMASRAAKGLSEFPITNGMQAIKAAEIVIKLERLLLGEPTEHTATDLEEVTRREIATLLLRPGEKESEIECLEADLDRERERRAERAAGDEDDP